MYYEREMATLYRNIDTAPQPDSSSSWLRENQGWLYEYGGSVDVVVCPDLHPETAPSLIGRSSYSANARTVTAHQKSGDGPSHAVWGGQRNETGLVRLINIEKPAAAFTFACRAHRPVVGDSYWDRPSSHGNSDYQLSFDHGGKANFLFVDGHVESLTPEQVEAREEDLFDL